MVVNRRGAPDAIRACLGGVSIGDGLDTLVMGAINVSPESFYGGSVAHGDDRLRAVAAQMVEAGAALIDIGAMSTAPYLATAISPAEEADRLGRAVWLVGSAIGVPISADTSRLGPAQAALDAGATVINDATGLREDDGLASAVARARAGLILVASPAVPMPADPVTAVAGVLGAAVRRAMASGVEAEAIAVDPGIGFFREQAVPWHEWDCRVLAGLDALRAVGRPLCVGVSRKSFIGAIAGAGDPSDRLPGSLAAATAAVLAGADLIRTHDVAETIQAVRVASAIRRAGHRGGGP